MTSLPDIQFAADTRRARELVALGQAFSAMTSGRVDGSDLFRAALVQSVAALDSWMHRVILNRSTNSLLGKLAIEVGRSANTALPLQAVSEILQAPSLAEREIAVRTHLAQRLYRQTFQQPDDIAKALNEVGIPKVWSQAFEDARGARTELGLVVERRNLIVHSCDVDPADPGTLRAMPDEDALTAIDVIERIMSGIAQLL